MFVSVGVHCDECKPGFFSLDYSNSAGCKPCNCDPQKSLSADCDRETGQCQCRPNTGGIQCSACREGWHGADCSQKCGFCDPGGSTSTTTCHPDTGLCYCKAHVILDSCDTCGDGYYGLVSHCCVARSGRTLVFDRRTFPVLRSTCSSRVTTYVGKLSAVGQQTRPTQPFILSG